MFNVFRKPRVLFLLSLAALLSAQEQTPSRAPESSNHASHSPAQKRKIKGLPNFGEVTPRLFRGAQPSPEGFRTLAQMGVDIVVNARNDRTDTEGNEVRQLGMQYVGIPWQCTSPHDDVFVKFLKLVQDNPHKKIFLHCRLGEDRTGMMIASYRMAAEGWTADEAMHEMQRFGFTAVHHVMCPGLASYEKEFPERLKNSPAFKDLHAVAESAQ
jgi:tyrosine-protein phosphatase SIW14